MKKDVHIVCGAVEVGRKEQEKNKSQLIIQDGGIFQGLKDEFVEIKTFDFKSSNVLSDKHRKEIYEKFMKRYTDYAMHARNSIKKEEDLRK